MNKKEALEEIEQNYKKLTVLENVKVSPQLAEELLKRNITNRPVKRATVNFYAGEMKKNNWQFNGDAIRISKMGKLLDGQHRLIAIIESETTQTYNIQLGLEDESFDVMDIGKVRNGTDTLAVAGYKHPGTVAAAVKIVSKYDAGKLQHDKMLKQADRLTNHEMKKWLQTHKEDLIIRCAERAGKFTRATNFLNAGTYCAFDYMFSRKNEAKSIEFFTLLSSGISVSPTENPAIYLMRQKLINMKGLVVDPVSRHALLIKAWNAFKQGKEIKRLHWAMEEDFPKIQ